MSYHLAGRFIEVCDCLLLCPCWVSETPDENHCTGLFLWQFDTIDGQPHDGHNGSMLGAVDVTGRLVISASIHRGKRPTAGAGKPPPKEYGGTWTVLVVDDGASLEQCSALVEAFRGSLEGPLENLADVSGTVVESLQARIELKHEDDTWKVTVTPAGADAPSLIEVAAEPAVLIPDGNALSLHNTALDGDLGVQPGTGIDALKATSLSLNLGSLPGGYLDVTGRSGMTGEFRYQHPPIDSDLKAHDRQPAGGER